MDTQIIIAAILGVSAGIIIGGVLAASRAREAYRLIREIKEWAGAPRWRDGDPRSYQDARRDIRNKIRAYETEE